jgi:hypothetical protein
VDKIFSLNGFRNLDVARHAFGEIKNQRKVSSYMERSPDPTYCLPLPSGGFLAIECSDSFCDERVTDCRKPARASGISDASHRVPLPHGARRKHRPDIHSSRAARRIRVEPKKLCQPSRIPMVGSHLMFVIESLRETVPVSNPPLPSFGTGVASLLKGDLEKPRDMRSDSTPGRNPPFPSTRQNGAVS